MRVTTQHALALLLSILLAVPSGLALVDGLSGADEVRATPAAGSADAPLLRPAPPPGPGTPTAPADPWPPGVRFEPGVAWTSMDAPGEFTFECPRQPGEAFIDRDDPTGNVNVVRASCPFRIIDDGDLLGSPQLAVRHDDVDQVAFFSLHGSSSDRGPTPRSRDPDNIVANGGLSHTKFTSSDGGWMWKDNPFGSEGLGETISGVMNRDGNMFVASLFSERSDLPSGDPFFKYHMRLHEERTVRDVVSHRGPRIDTMESGNQVDEVNLVLVTPPRYVETDAQYEAYVNSTKEAEKDNGTPAPSNETQVGQYAMPRDPSDHSLDLVAAVWHERALDWRNATTGKSSWIQVLTRSASERDDWRALPKEQLVGPCRSASNPVAWNGRIYVACVVDAGYRGRPDARIGDVDIWAIEPYGGTKHFVSHVDSLGPDGRPRLAANEEGRFTISLTRILPNGAVDFASLQLAWGWYGRHWDPAQEVGYTFSKEWSDQKLREARVTAMEMLRVDKSEILFLSFMERVEGDLSNEDPEAIQPVEYRKLLGSWERCLNEPWALYDLNVGILRHPFEEGVVNNVTGAFDDLHDGMVAMVDPVSGRHRLHFAYGDHGVIQYGAVDARSATPGFCPIPAAPVLYTPPPAVPAALMLPSGVGVGTALAASVPAALGLGSLLISKRRVALAAAAKAK